MRRRGHGPAFPLAGPALAFAVALLSLGPGAAHVLAQDCLLSVEREEGDAGYQPREPGSYCEGTFVALQSAPLNVQVISFTAGGDLNLPSRDSAEDPIVEVAPALLPEAVDSVTVIGRTRQSNVNWALDAVIPAADTLEWNLEPAVWDRSLENLVGVYARARARLDPLEDPVYLPVRVRATGMTPGPAPDGLTLVVKLPGASDLRWKSASSSDSLIEAESLDVDGYFRLELPRRAAAAGSVDTLALYWRPRGQMTYHPVPEFLQVVRR